MRTRNVKGLSIYGVFSFDQISAPSQQLRIAGVNSVSAQNRSVISVKAMLVRRAKPVCVHP